MKNINVKSILLALLLIAIGIGIILGNLTGAKTGLGVFNLFESQVATVNVPEVVRVDVLNTLSADASADTLLTAADVLDAGLRSDLLNVALEAGLVESENLAAVDSNCGRLGLVEFTV